MFTHFTTVINSLKNLGKTYTNEEMIEKVLSSLLKHWQPKVTVVRKAKELATLPWNNSWALSQFMKWNLFF